MTKPRKTYTYSRTLGTPNWVEFPNGIRIHKPSENRVFIRGEGWNRYVYCIDMDNHFVALNPYFANPKYPGLNTMMAYCSCGSPAVVVGYNVYKHGASASPRKDGSIPGELLVCQAHAENGHHLDGST